MDEIRIITKDLAKSLLPKREEVSHKGSYGSVLNIAGSINYRGAAYLSTVAALKAGAGYVALASINEVINAVSTLCPEAVFIPLDEKNGTIKSDEYKKLIALAFKYSVLSFGCGLSSLNGDNSEVQSFVKSLLKNIETIKNPVIIDADGLNLISEIPVKKLPENAVLTPHPAELSRLLDVDVSEIQKNREQYVLAAAQKFGAIVVLKGHSTLISDGKKVFMNKTGNSALAKAGSGDVLTGMIAGFCAQGVSPLESAVLSVYLHGLCGEIASKELSEYSVNASDLIKYLPFAIKSLTD